MDWFKPFVIEASQAHQDNIVEYTQDGTAVVRLNQEVYIVPLDHQYDLTQATIFGLNERLTLAATSPVVEDGITLRDKFNEEWERYSEALMSAEGNKINYGYYAYYPDKNDLVRLCPPFWHHVVAVASSSKLYSDKEKKLSWAQIREVFENTTVGVAGCSVGSNIIHNIVMDIRPKKIKIADKSLYKMENINRVRLSYSEIIKNNSQKSDIYDLGLVSKAEVVAKQLYSIDPFLEISVYSDGIHEQNVDEFFTVQEKTIDILVEEVDDPRIKIFLRQEARKRRIPVLMMSDLGSNVQIDLLRYDLNPNLSFSYRIEDEKLLEATEAVYDNPGDKQTFIQFVDSLVGQDYKTGELREILEGKTEIPTSTLIPQLGSTAAVAGGIAAEIIARVRLGYDFPSRVVFNKQTFEVKKYF